MAAEGDVTIDPPAEIAGTVLSGVIRRFRPDARERAARSRTPRGQTAAADHRRDAVVLEANVDLLGDASFARAQGAEGIGLYRSELLLAGRAADEVTEDAQYEVYRQLLQEMQPAPVTIRTFDIDEDQLATGEQQRDSLWPQRLRCAAQPAGPALDPADAQAA